MMYCPVPVPKAIKPSDHGLKPRKAQGQRSRSFFSSSQLCCSSIRKLTYHEKTDKVSFIEVKNFCFAKDNVITPDKELSKLSKKMNNLI